MKDQKQNAMAPRKFVSLIFLWLALGSYDPILGVLPTGPGQPPSGPGGASYQHASYLKTIIGTYEEKFFIFEPAQPSPPKAPLLIFLHGWFSSNPEFYQAWIEHLCKRGWIVVFPCYQAGGETAPRFTGNVIRSIKEALGILRNGFHVWPDIDRVAIIGHEAGGVVAANIAAAARYFKLPSPGVLMILEPSRGIGGNNDSGIDLFDLSGIRSNSLMLVVVGEDDLHTGQSTAREIFYQADQVESRNKNFITLLTDLHGTPAVVGDRFAPYSPNPPFFNDGNLPPKGIVPSGYERELVKRRHEFVKLFRSSKAARATRTQGVDALDVLGTWRLFDSLASAAFDKGSRAEALGNTENQRFIGKWSDDRRIRGVLSTERP